MTSSHNLKKIFADGINLLSLHRNKFLLHSKNVGCWQKFRKVRRFSQILKETLARLLFYKIFQFCFRSLTRLNAPSVLLASIRKESTIPKKLPSETIKSNDEISLKPRVSRVRNQAHLAYPAIETLTDLREEYYMPSNFTTVRYGDYDFKQCMDGYVHIFLHAFKPLRGIPSDTAASFVVYYGTNHPL